MKRASTLSDCIPNIVLEERVTIRIRGREESGPTGFPPIVPDAMDDTVCRNAHGVVCPFERLRNCGHVLLKDNRYHIDLPFFFSSRVGSLEPPPKLQDLKIPSCTLHRIMKLIRTLRDSVS